ncbi:MAG: hypothetical protein OXF79_05475 [Chloroflexi bacterium]|nr:hypothetical protein [Chloroflexota bacterium]
MTTHSFADWNDVQEFYFSNGLTDGLPVVPPTPERVQAMLDYAGVDADHDLGTEIIRQKRFTAGKAAVNAVMAGCLPEHFPVVMAALSAITDRSFNLHASSTSTNGATVLTVVSGPYAETIGMNAGVEMMGNGSRANAAIGRAVNLFKSNFYGSVPVVMDNSTFGHAGKITFSFPENLAISPWPSLASELGYGDDATIVRAFATLAPLQVTLHGDRDPADFLTTVAHAMLAFGPGMPEVICVISPEAMQHVAAAGWSRQRVADFLHDKARLPVAEWMRWKRMGHELDHDRLVPVVPEADRITVLPGGGMAGAFISLISTWGSSRSVTRQVAVPN